MSTRICLIVDDEPAIRSYLRAILEQEHLQSVEAEDAGQALRIVHQLGGRLDLIVSDIKMPGDMDGLDLAHSIRNTFPSIPVVLMSGFCEGGAKQSSEFECIAKPFWPKTILSAVERAMDSARKSAAKQPPSSN